MFQPPPKAVGLPTAHCPLPTPHAVGLVNGGNADRFSLRASPAEDSWRTLPAFLAGDSADGTQCPRLTVRPEGAYDL